MRFICVFHIWMIHWLQIAYSNANVRNWAMFLHSNPDAESTLTILVFTLHNVSVYMLAKVDSKRTRDESMVFKPLCSGPHPIIVSRDSGNKRNISWNVLASKSFYKSRAIGCDRPRPTNACVSYVCRPRIYASPCPLLWKDTVTTWKLPWFSTIWL